MVQKICNHAAVLVIGLFLGGLLMTSWVGSSWVGSWPAEQVHATATQGSGNFAIATGFVDDGVEALYFLDFLTGDLRAVVMSRRTAEFDAFFEYNVQQDFGRTSKNPKFLMVTGLVDLPRGRGTTQLGSSLIYIAEATSGQVFSYALPWNSSLYAAGKPQTGGFINMGGGSIRTTFVRDEE